LFSKCKRKDSEQDNPNVYSDKERNGRKSYRIIKRNSTSGCLNIRFTRISVRKIGIGAASRKFGFGAERRMEASAESAAYYLGIENFSMNKILEYNL
jgi:hypothetical protein